MADADPKLPRLPTKALNVGFAKTHLVTFLQMLKGGLLPELVGKVNAASSQGAVAAFEPRCACVSGFEPSIGGPHG